MTTLVSTLAGRAGTPPPPPATSPAGSGGAPPCLARAASLVAPALAEVVGHLAPPLRIPVEHHLRGGGKRIRAAIVLLSAAAVGGDDEAALDGAVAIELVHNYSLLHDDVIDGDRERRHLPTVWAEFGVGAAIVAGDALAALAMQLLLERPTPPRVRAAARLAAANQAMIVGQASDMAFESRSTVTVAECLEMEEGKTGALLSCAAALGAILGGAATPVIDAFVEFGVHLGIAFQAVDDLLGVWGEPSVTGKPVGSDLLSGKKTLPVTGALATGGPEAAELRRLLDGGVSPEEVGRASDLLERAGMRSEVAALADAHLELALGALARGVPAAGDREELEEVARFVTARDR